MKDIQEKRLENEIKVVTESKSDIKRVVKKISKEEYQIDITIPTTLTKNALDIELRMLIQKNYPFNPPKLFFITKFIFPHLADCRDVIEDVISPALLTISAAKLPLSPKRNFISFAVSEYPLI